MEALVPVKNNMAPANYREACEFAKMIAQSQLVPKAYRGKPADILIAMQMGAEVGLKPLQAIQGINVINGKPTMSGELMLSLISARPDCGGVEESLENGIATCTVHRKGRPSVTRTFSVEDAKRARKWGSPGPWTEYPQRMLLMRARGFAIRDSFPDALKGLLPEEEVRDYNIQEPYKQDAHTTQPEEKEDPEYSSDAQPLISHELGDVLKLIKDAKSKDDLGYVIEPAGKLQGRELEMAQNAYRDKLKSLRQSQNPVDTLKELIVEER